MEEREKILDAARDAITIFCKNYGLNIVGVMLYGSYAKGLETKNSDVDVIIVDEGVNGEFRVQKKLNGFKLQVKHISYSCISEKLEQSSVTQQPFLPLSLCEAEILFDKYGFCTYLKSIAQNILETGPKPADNFKIELIRSGFVNYLNDGANEKYTGHSRVETVMWASQSIRLCMDIVLAKSGSWIHYSTELKSKIMQTNHSGVNDSLNICLSDFLIDYDTRKFARELKMIMEEFISFGWDTEFPSVQTTL